MLKKLNTFLIRLIVSILSLGLLFYFVRGEINEAVSHLANLAVLPLLIAIALNFVSLIVVTFRIGTILSVQGIHLSFSRRYYLWVISLFFNLFLPSAVGGDITKGYYIYKDSGKKMASITSVILDRFFGLLATISIGFFAFLVAREHIGDPKVGHLLFWATGVVLVGVLFVLNRRFSRPAEHLVLALTPGHFRSRLARLFAIFELYRDRHLNLWIAFFHSLVAQALYMTIVYFLGKSVHIDLPITIYFLFVPLITVISMIPSIGGLGVREAATVYLFRELIPVEQAVALSLLCDLFIYGIGAACGILYAIRGGASIRELKRLENEGNNV